MSNEQKPRRKPVEQSSLSVPFFTLAAILFLLSVWALIDEVGSGRRVWKEYQAQFEEIAAEQVRSEIEAEMDRLQNETTINDGEDKLPPLPVIEEKLQEASAVMSSSDYNAIEQNIAEKEREVYLVTQDWKIAKSKDVEYAFFYEEALKHHPEQVAEYRAKLDGVAEDISVAEEQLDELKTELAELQSRRDKMLSEYTKWDELKKTATREIAVMRDKLRRLERPWYVPEALWYDGSLEQIVLRGYRVNAFDENQYTVDRCITCHMGVDKSGFESEDIPLVARTHPDRDGILAQHPVKKFACTPCHQGQGPAVSATTAAEHSDLDEVHGLIHHWSEPLLGKVKSGHYHEYEEERIPDYTQASCFKCHSSQYEIESPHADLLNAGKEYVTKLGCWGCHNVKHVGDQALGATGKKVGPSLNRVMEKVDADWIVSWVENPQAHLARSRMPQYPDFGRKNPAEYEEDLHALAAFLNNRSEEWPELQADSRSESYFTSGNADRGEELFKSVGCMGCHAMGERPEDWARNDNPFYQDYDVAPDLYNTGNKIRSAKWVYHWIKDPTSYDPNTSMPSLRLTDDEALDITTYLMQQKGKDIPEVGGLDEQLEDEKLVERGEWIVSNYGCFGCHNITGFEKTGKISVELSEFANKTPNELAFGVRTDIPHTWEDWTKAKLQQPRGFETERQLNKMPDYHLDDDAAHAIRVFLKSQTGQQVGSDWYFDLSPAESAQQKGRTLVEELNCKACHGIDGKGGRIVAYYDDPNSAPPQLNKQGDRVQADWFYNFLMDVQPIRPWVDVRMPSFDLTDEEAKTIVQYFQGKADNMDPFVRIDLAAIDPENVERGKELFAQSGCANCHFKKTSGFTEAQLVTMGPYLGSAHERLKPEWIERWLALPSAVLPYTRMYTPFGLQLDENGDPILYEDDTEEDIKRYQKALEDIDALRDYIMVFGREAEYQKALRDAKRQARR